MRLVIGVTDSDWDESQHVVGKLTTSILRALVDQCLVELRGLMCVLFGSEELVCIGGWDFTVCD